MKIAEREHQADQLHQLFLDCLTGNGRAALLDGAVATGKTELLNRTAERAACAGGLALRATCSSDERALPFGVLDQLLHSVRLPDGPAEKAAQWFERAAAEVANDGPTPEVIGSGMAQVFRGLCLVLLELAESAPLLIGIDDIHCADVLSLHCLLYLIRRLGSARITLILTDNPELSELHPTFRTALLDQQYCSRLQLGPLTGDGVRRLLTTYVGRSTADCLAPDFAALSGGNPLLLTALVEDQCTTGEARTESYGRAVLCLLHRSGAPSVPQTARALAVLDAEAAPEQLGRLAVVEPARVDQALRLLTAAGLLTEGTFCHHAARHAVLEDLPAEGRVDLHLRAAQMLHEQGGPATQVAQHLLAADAAPRSWAVTVLLEAAEQEQLDGRPQVALAALELAHRDCTEERARPEIAALLVRAHRQNDPVSACRHVDALISAAASGRLDDRNALHLVRQLLWHGRADTAGDVLAVLRRPVTDPHGEPEPDPAAAELRDTELWISWTHPVLADRHHRGTGQAGSPAESWSRPAALLADALLRGRSHEVVAEAEQVLRDHWSAEHAWRAEEPTLLALSVLTAAGRAGSAAAWCDRLLGAAQTRHSPTWKALLSAARADAAVRQGDLAPAVEHSRLALNHLTHRAWGVAIGLPLGSLILATTRMGRYDEAAAQLARPVPEAMFHTRYGLHYRHARGHYRAATGHLPAALEDFQSCGDLMRDWGIDVPGIVPWRTSAAEVWLKLGNRDEADRLVDEQLSRPEATAAPDRGLALRLLAASLPARRRVPLLTEALELLEDCDDQYEQVRTLMDLRDAYDEIGDSRRARMHSRRARRMAGMYGGTPLSRALLALPDNAENPTPPVAGLGRATALTESESRVAALAARGYTNREIATKLFVSASTVEQHLTRVYRKLGVKNRKDLPVVLRTLANGFSAAEAGGRGTAPAITAGSACG